VVEYPETKKNWRALLGIGEIYFEKILMVKPQRGTVHQYLAGRSHRDIGAVDH
jgi:hypothetical protein